MELGRNASWGWICFLFAAQAIGSMAIAKLFRLDLRELIIPIVILCAGVFVSAIFQQSESGRFGKWQWWVPALIYALFIFALSDRAYPDAKPVFSTKVFHPVEYFVLGFFISLALLPGFRRKGLLVFSSRVFLLGVLFAASDEIHQAFIPGRGPSLKDVLVWDLMGICLGWASMLTLRRLLNAVDSTDKAG
jgi:VanZ family protein